MSKLDVGRKTYEYVRAKTANGSGKPWDELTDEERLRWMEQLVALAFNGPVFA